jgi:hypothetical protein
MWSGTGSAMGCNGVRWGAMQYDIESSDGWPLVAVEANERFGMHFVTNCKGKLVLSVSMVENLTCRCALNGLAELPHVTNDMQCLSTRVAGRR